MLVSGSAWAAAERRLRDGEARFRQFEAVVAKMARRRRRNLADHRRALGLDVALPV